MKYWYYTFKSNGKDFANISVMRGNEFNIISAINFSIEFGNNPILVTYWHEISKKQFLQIKEELNINPLIEDDEDEINNDENLNQEFIEKMYSMYPSKCPLRNRSLGKSSKDKEKIRRLLKKYNKNQIEIVFKNEIDSKYGKEWMQNFSTFLNNFPDPSCIDCSSQDKKDNLYSGNLVIGDTIYR